MQALSDHYHDNIPLNQSSFVNLLVEIIKQYLSRATDVPALVEGGDKDELFRDLTYQYLSE
ncbi:MAG: hypothetical protein LBD11_09065 [Candidatus Peribacteria bacterium]|nr:hypothetical protein [Candidatus Peribacteria bacterium]